MGLFSDIWRLMRAADRADREEEDDEEEMMRDAAEWAQMYAAGLGQPLGTHGAMTANPYANLAFMNSAIPAAGIVLDLWETEQRLDNVPIYQVALEIRRDDCPPYQTFYQTVIAAAALPNWQPGKALTFRVSPDDPHSLMLG